MPSLLSPHPSSNSRSYTPLADEVNPPFGNHAPTVTRNGTVVYGNVKRVSSIGSDGQSSSSASGLNRSDSEETLSQTASARVASRTTPEMLELPEEEGDLGELRRSSTAAKGKGKEKVWDEEMGREEVMADSSYPPVNSVEKDERRIQDNLAKFAARDMARRRAARVSRQIPTSPKSSSATSSSSTSSFMRRPFSLVSTSSDGGKRSSTLGMMSGWMNGAVAKEELPVTSPSRAHFNPYDPPEPLPTPRMLVSPNPPPSASPFADPIDTSYQNTAERRMSTASSSTSPALRTPIETGGYGYAGAGWRGGAAAVNGDQGDQGRPKSSTGEKWWHALCSWGNDLDGGYDDPNEGRNQAGRTNPNE